MKKPFQGTIKVRQAQEAQGKGFPVVTKHDEARCFHCGSKLRSPRSSTKVNGVPEHKEGQWFGQCQADCGYGTFYDIEGDTHPRPAPNPLV